MSLSDEVLRRKIDAVICDAIDRALERRGAYRASLPYTDRIVEIVRQETRHGVNVGQRTTYRNDTGCT